MREKERLFFFVVCPLFFQGAAVVFHGLFQGAAAGFQVREGAEEIFFAGGETGGFFPQVFFDFFFFRADASDPLFFGFFVFGFFGFELFLEFFTGFGDACFQPIGRGFQLFFDFFFLLFSFFFLFFDAETELFLDLPQFFQMVF